MSMHMRLRSHRLYLVLQLTVHESLIFSARLRFEKHVELETPEPVPGWQAWH